MNIRHLTLLHSNDLHASFTPAQNTDAFVGGFSRLSGYVDSVREEEPNTLYVIAGDTFTGQLIDDEFNGEATVNMMNMIGPDVCCLGNHSVDHGAEQLLFLEKTLCEFDLICANIRNKNDNKYLFNPYVIKTVDDINILFIGVVTEKIMGRKGKDQFMADNFVYTDPYEEIKAICARKPKDIHLTVILSHLGDKEDFAIAEKLTPEDGVHIIIGGHSHKKYDTKINGILTSQVGELSTQIGRYELEIDLDNKENPIVSDFHNVIMLHQKNIPSKNWAIKKKIIKKNDLIKEINKPLLVTLPQMITHPERTQETQVGNMFADMVKDIFGLDIVLLGSGGMREKTLGPEITVGDIKTMYAYKETLNLIRLTGKELKTAAKTFLSEQTEYYQISEGWRFVLDKSSGELSEATYDDKEIDELREYNVGIEAYHFGELKKYLGLDAEVILKRHPKVELAQNVREKMIQYIKDHPEKLKYETSGRTEIV